jgi:putative tricarboxylic transport membrane protein
MDWLNAIIGVFDPSIFLFLLLGVVVGYVIGILPGLSATMGVAILTPLTFWLAPAQGFAMLIGVFNSAIFAGGISAVLINTPGTPASIATTFDGYALTKMGRPGLGLGVNTIFSCIGGWIGAIVLMIAAFPLARFALKFGPSEFFTLAIFGLAMMVSVSGKNAAKGIATGFLGLLIATVGLDPMYSTQRFTFGQQSLMDGVSFIPVMIGLFGLGEVWAQMFDGVHNEKAEKLSSMGRILPTWQELKRCTPASLVACAISIIVGIIPGTGGDIAGIISWDRARKMSKKPEEFGHGSVEGVAVTCLANNAAMGGALITMLTLGVPGESITAILIGSLMMYGMDPGPRLFTEHSGFVMTFMALTMVAYAIILAVGLLSAKYSTIVLNVRKEIIWMTVIILCTIGAYAMNSSYVDVIIMAVSGFIGFLFRKMDYPLGPIILGLLLGRMAESNFRRAISTYDNPLQSYYTSPIAIVLIILTLMAVIMPLIKRIKQNRK